MHRTTPFRLACVLSALGALLTVAGIAADGRIDASDLRAVGVGFVVVGMIWLLQRRSDYPLSDAYETGHEDGFKKGFRHGRRVGLPRLVKLDERCCGSCKRGSGNVVPLATESTLAHNVALASLGDRGGSVESPAWQDSSSAADGFVSPM